MSPLTKKTKDLSWLGAPCFIVIVVLLLISARQPDSSGNRQAGNPPGTSLSPR